MAPKHDFVADIDANNRQWTLLVRVFRMWHVQGLKGDKLPFSIELVLMDSRGDRIHASIKKQLIYKFEKLLKEGFVYSIGNFNVGSNVGEYRTTRHTYKLNFQISTKVRSESDGDVPAYVYSFTEPARIFASDYDSNYLVDVMGVLTGVGIEREIDRNGVKTKMNVIELDCDGYRFKCTLWGNYVDDLNSFLLADDVDNAVVAILFGKIKIFQGKPVLQNTMNCTKLLFNHESSEAVELKNRMGQHNDSPAQGLTQLQDVGRVSLTEDFLTLTPRSTIEALKNCREESCFVVLATIKHILDEEGWWYTACVCSKKVYPDSNMYFCEKCNKHVLTVTPRYRIKMRVIDETGSATFVIFDRYAAILFNKSCAAMIEDANSSIAVPHEVLSLEDETFLSKVEVNNSFGSRYEPSYTVKKITNESGLIQKFKEVKNSQGVVAVDGVLDATVDCIPTIESPIPIAQDLMSKFSDTVAESGKNVEQNKVIDLCNITDESLPRKQACNTVDKAATATGPSKILKKDIKIEKK